VPEEQVDVYGDGYKSAFGSFVEIAAISTVGSPFKGTPTPTWSLFEIFDLQFFYYPSSIFKDPLL
jgi:hypothetical protein